MACCFAAEQPRTAEATRGMTERALELNSEAPEENQMTKPVKSLVFVLQTSENGGTKRNDVEYVDA